MFHHALSHIPPAWRWALGLWLVARVVLTALPIGVWAADVPIFTKASLYYEIAPIQGGLAEPLLGYWQRWDAIHYQRIIQNGYTAHTSVFFPLYPLLAWSLTRLVGFNDMAALLMVSNLATLVALKVLYELAETDFGPGVARAATAVAVLLPTSFFLFAPFPNALLLMLILLAYQAARRGQFWRAGLFGLATGLTHGTAVPLAILLLGEVLRVMRAERAAGQRMPRWALLAVPLAPLVGTALFLGWRALAGMPSYAEVQETLFLRGLQWPWISLARIPNSLLVPIRRFSGWADLLLFGVTLVVIAWGWKRLRWELTVFMLAALLLMFSAPDHQTPLMGYGRYALILFPLFLALGNWMQGVRRKTLLLAPAVFSQLLLISFFFLWLWVE